ncbi:MAG: DUF2764 domain-containing protein [Candidatus Omnitrophica bacterium]|nr:DUF2764 domain-containing protein [Candidatus Omnitrophota bacterium]
MSRQYYYLVTSLPTLRLDDYKEPYRVQEFMAQLLQHADAADSQAAREVLGLYDHGTIIDAVTGRSAPWSNLTGNWTPAEIRAQLADAEFPWDSYLRDFLAEVSVRRQQAEPLNRAQIEQILLTYYYRRMSAHANRFIREYFTFEVTLRNVLAAVNRRKFSAGYTELIPSGEESLREKLQSAAQADFGLSREIEYLPEILALAENPDLLHGQKFLDGLRWEMIDRINTFSYFSIDVLLGYLLKLMMVERWIALDEQHGKELFEARAAVAAI